MVKRTQSGIEFFTWPDTVDWDRKWLMVTLEKLNLYNSGATDMDIYWSVLEGKSDAGIVLVF